MKNFYLLLALPVILALATTFVQAQTTYYSIAPGGAWNSSATWGTSPAGPGGAGIPTGNDDVILQAGAPVSLANSGSGMCRNFYFDVAATSPIFTLGTSANLTINGTLLGYNGVPTANLISNGGGQFTFTGSSLNTTIYYPQVSNNEIIALWNTSTPIPLSNFNLTGSATFDNIVNASLQATNLAFSSLFFLNSGNLSFGSTINNLILSHPSAQMTIASGATMSSNKNNQIRIRGSNARLTIEEGGTLNASGPINGDGPLINVNLIIVEGTLIAQRYVNSNSMIIRSPGQLLTYYSYAPNQTEGWWYQSNSPSMFNLDGIVEYGSNSNQNVYAVPNGYGDLIFSGGGTKTWNGAAKSDVNGDFTIESGISVVENGQPIVIAGNFTNNGNWAPNANVTFNGSSDQTITGNATLTFNGKLRATNMVGTVSLGDQNIILNGDFEIETNAIFNPGIRNVTLDGNIVANGTLQAGTGNSTFTIAGTTSYTGSGGVSFNNIIINIGGIFNGSATNPFAVAGNFTNNGTFNSNNGTVTLNGSSDQQITSGGSSFNNATINKGGGAVTLADSLNLVGSLEFLSGTTLNSNGNLTLLSTSDGPTGNARIGTLSGGAAVNGNVTIQRYMSGEGEEVWRHISAFVSGATINDLLDDFPLIQPMNYYDETLPGSLNDRWVPVSDPSTPLNVGWGYITGIFEAVNPTIWDLTGPINQGTVNFNVTYSGSTSDDGWNLLGNPYPSTINWDIASGWTKSNISSTVYVRDYVADVYLSWNGSVGTLGSGDIASGQAFFVVTTGASPAISINENAKTSTTGVFYRQQEEELTNLLVVGISNGERNDFTFINFLEDAHTEFDVKYDGYKLDNSSVNIASRLESGERMCINYLPNPVETTEVKLDVYLVESGSYSLSFEELESFDNGSELFLVDAYLGKEVNLRDIESYSFQVNTANSLSFGPDRFKIVFQNSITGLEISKAENALSIFPNPANDLISIELNDQYLLAGEKVKVQVYEISNNRSMLEDELRNYGNNYQLNLNISNFGRGVYLVVVQTDNQKYYSKFIKH